jgi:hypothetical protein
MVDLVAGAGLEKSLEYGFKAVRYHRVLRVTESGSTRIAQGLSCA